MGRFIYETLKSGIAYDVLKNAGEKFITKGTEKPQSNTWKTVGNYSIYTP